MPLSTLKVPLNIGLYFLFAFIREMRFFHFLAPKMLKNAQKCHLAVVLFDFRQLLFHDLPPKNASKDPKIAIFRFANIVIFKIGLL